MNSSKPKPTARINLFFLSNSISLDKRSEVEPQCIGITKETSKNHVRSFSIDVGLWGVKCRQQVVGSRYSKFEIRGIYGAGEHLVAVLQFQGLPSFILASKLKALKVDLNKWNEEIFGDVGKKRKDFFGRTATKKKKVFGCPKSKNNFMLLQQHENVSHLKLKKQLIF